MHSFAVRRSGSGSRDRRVADSSAQVWLWDTHATEAAAAVCAMAGHPLSRAEWQAYIPGRPYAPPGPLR